MKEFVKRMLRRVGGLDTARQWARHLGEYTLAGRRRAAEMRGFYRSFVRPGDLVFDIGANVGDWTAVFVSLGARVVAFEPQPACAESLRARFQAVQNVMVASVGIAEAEGELTLSVSSLAPVLATFSAEWRERSRFAGKYVWDSVCRVPVTTLDAAIAKYGVPAFCKIDVEGFECQVLRGLSQPLKCLSFEFTAEFFLESTTAAIVALESMERLEYNCSMNGALQMHSADWLPADAFEREIGTSLGRDTWGDIFARRRAYN